MATNILDAFIVTFGLDSSEFEKGSDEVERTSKRTRDQVKKTFGDVETGGKQLGQALRTISNEALGLFLAFSGASSLTSFIHEAMTGAASADRLGQTLGMATGKVVAWRQAMASVGGSEGSADAALSIMERAVQSFRLTGTTGMDADLLGLGINRGDLEKLSPDQLLLKLSGARGQMDGKEFNARMQRIGMPQDMTNFLMQGQAAASKQIDALAKNTDTQDQAAKAMEELQGELGTLKSELSAGLLPGITDLVHVINQFLQWLPKGAVKDFVQDPIAATGGNAWDHLSGFLSRHGFNGAGKWVKDHMGGADHVPAAPAQPGATPSAAGQPKSAGASQAISAGAPSGGSRPSLADRNNNPGNLTDTGGRFRKFTTPEEGMAAQARQLLIDYDKHGLHTIAQIINDRHHGWANEWARGNSHSSVMSYISALTKALKVGANDVINLHHLPTLNAFMAAQAKHEGYHRSSTVHIGKIDVHTQAKDAHGVARDLHHTIRQRVIQADGGMQN